MHNRVDRLRRFEIREVYAQRQRRRLRCAAARREIRSGRVACLPLVLLLLLLLLQLLLTTDGAFQFRAQIGQGLQDETKFIRVDGNQVLHTIDDVRRETRVGTGRLRRRSGRVGQEVDEQWND